MILPLFIKEYVVIIGLIVIATIVFYFFFKDKIIMNWALVCLFVVTAAYFSINIWIFFTILFFLIIILLHKKSNLTKLGYFFLLLPLIPNVAEVIRLPGAIPLFTLSYSRMLSLCILFPLFLFYSTHPKKRIFSYKIDKYVIAFLTLAFFLGFRDTTFTNTFRMGFENFVDYFLPYFVISRTVNKAEDFKKLFYFLIFIALFLALLSIFETAKRWHMYEGLPIGGGSYYAARGGLLRAYGSFDGNTIPFGMYFCIMAAFLFFINYFNFGKLKVGWLTIIFFIAMLCTLSRGPIVGYAVLFLLMFKSKLFKLIPIVLVILVLFFVSPLGKVTISSLPFIGTKDQGTITYRQRVLTNSIEVIKRSPLTGSNTYLQEPEMEELRTGQNIIDILNAYVQIALSTGIIGLILYLSIFISILINLWRRYLHTYINQIIMLGKVLFSVTIASMVMISTVSLISLLPHYIWILFGFCAGYIHMAASFKDKSLSH